MGSSDLPLDNISLYLAALLQRDGRMSLVDLAKEIGVSSHNTVQNRLTEMQNQKYLRIVAEMNAKNLGFEVVLILYSTLRDEDHSKIINLYNCCPRVIQVGSLIGNYDVFIMAYAENRSILESITRGHCFYNEQIQFSERLILILGEEIKPPFFPIEFPVISEENETPCKANCTDCDSYKKEHCTGCPGTEYYNGPLIIKKQNKQKINE